jgi:hypothetical protein
LWAPAPERNGSSAEDTAVMQPAREATLVR